MEIRGSLSIVNGIPSSHPRDVVALCADEVLAADAELAAVFVAVDVAELSLGAGAHLAAAAPVQRHSCEEGEEGTPRCNWCGQSTAVYPHLLRSSLATRTAP